MRTLDSWIEVDKLLSEAKLDEMVLLLRELVKWSKFGGKQQMKAVLRDNLHEDAEKLVYEFSDGERSTRDIEEAVGVGKTSVARYWDKWAVLGIVEESNKIKGRMQRICSLREVGIDIPEISKKTSDTPAVPPKSEGTDAAAGERRD